MKAKVAQGSFLILATAVVAGVAMSAASFLAEPGVAAAGVPGPWGSKDCIAWCEVNGVLDQYHLLHQDHARAHNPQAPYYCPFTPSIKDASPPQP